MAIIKKLKDEELIGGSDSTTVYPITSTCAIYCQQSDTSAEPGKFDNRGMYPFFSGTRPRLLEDRLQLMEININTYSHGYFGHMSSDIQYIGNRLTTLEDKHTQDIQSFDRYLRNRIDLVFSSMAGIDQKYSTITTNLNTRLTTLEKNGSGINLEYLITTADTDVEPTDTKVYSALKSDSLYLSKIKDDTSEGKIKFSKGLTFGDFTDTTGGSLDLDAKNHSVMTTDYLYVRMKAIYNELEVVNTKTMGGKLVISAIDSNRILKVETVNVTYNGSSQKAYRCYFLGEQDGVEIVNKWEVGDQAYAKTFNIKTNASQNLGDKYYWRLVIGVSSDVVTIDEVKYHYIDLSVTDCDTSSGVPAVNDVVSQLGNRTNAIRQSALIFSAEDEFAPSITLHFGINYYSLDNTAYVEYGVNHQTNKAFFNVFGDAYIGDRPTADNNYEGTSYIQYDGNTKKITIKGDLSIKSTIGGQSLIDYIKNNSTTLTADDVLNLINSADIIAQLQNQIDGAIETWYYEGAPTLYNAPAKDWTDVSTKNIHLGDLYYDKKSGKAYRFMLDNGAYTWVLITDEDITKALANAQLAQETADGKMTVFATKANELPKPPYQTGDIWVNAIYSDDDVEYNNDLLRCYREKPKGAAPQISDWVLATKYTDDTALTVFKEEYASTMQSYKNQLDGKVETWYYDYKPLTSNPPASTWVTKEEKLIHAGDLFYNTSTGYAYRWTGEDWDRLKDSDITDAMRAASEAQDTADGKRTTFLKTPIPPYDEGDLWTITTDDGNILKVCIKARTADEEFSEADWKESNDASLNIFSDVINKSLEGIQDQLDKKAETWYQSTDPSLAWTTDEMKAEHRGDLWFNTSNNTTWFYNGKAWEKQDIPKEVFDIIDGKSSIYASKPSSYEVNDLWILEDTYILSGVEYSKGELVTAIRSNTTFDPDDWTKKVKYTDDSALNAFKREYAELMKSYKEQLDGKVETWYYDYIPTTSTLPASNWTTDEDKQKHAGDLFYNTATGYVYRWTGSVWSRIKDGDIIAAMEAAAAAQDTADHKRTNFTTTPVPPYDKGDLWTMSSNTGNILKVCVTAKAEGEAFSADDWQESNDASLNDFANTIATTLEGIQDQIDKKAETWYQSTDPSINWATKEEKAEHRGDLWFNTTNNTTWFYTGSAWVQQDIPSSVFDKIDGKSSIYVSKPSSYKINDLWILEDTYTLGGKEYSKGELVVAIRSNTTFSASDWTKKVKYTDDTAAEEAKKYAEEVRKLAEAAQAAATALSKTVSDFRDDYNVFISDGVLTSAEIQALQSDRARIKDAYNAAKNNYNDVYDCTVLLDENGKDLTIKQKLKTKFDELTAATDELVGESGALVDLVSNWEKADESGKQRIRAVVETRLTNFTTKYDAFYAALSEVKVYITNTLYSTIVSGLERFDYLTEVLEKGSTDISGGLVLTNVLALRNLENQITSGISGIVDSTKKGDGIAAWWGGPMADLAEKPDDETDTSKYATSLIRFDGTGYFANGAISWDETGNLNVNPASFIINKTDLGLYVSLFSLIMKEGHINGDSWEDIAYAIPMTRFSKMQIADYITIGNIKIIYDDANKALKVENIVTGELASLYTTGGISAFGSSSVSGGSGGGGLDGTVVSYATIMKNNYTDDDYSVVPNAYSIKYLATRINYLYSDMDGGSATSILVSGDGNAITEVTKSGKTLKFTKGTTFLTSHQSLADYAKKGTTLSAYGITDAYTKTEVDNLGYTANAGTVTSVGISVPTGLAVSGTPITSKGTIAISLASGYAIPTTAKQATWDNAVSSSHSHTNKSILDNISAAKITNWNDAYNWYKLMTTDESNPDGVINKWNEVVAFLNNISQSSSLEGIVDGINTSISNETTRAKGAESTLTSNLNSEISRAKAAESTNASNITTNKNNITTLQGYFSNGSAKSALKLTTARSLWGNSFDGTANVSGSITLASDKYIQIGNARISYDSTHKSIKITNTTSSEVMSLYATGGISAFGSSSVSTSSGGGGVDGTVLTYEQAIKLTSNDSEASNIASAWSIKQLSNVIAAISAGIPKISVTSSGSGNAITAASYDINTGKMTFTKGTTFLTSHQSLSGYLTTSAASSTYLTKTAAASTYQPKGTYLTSHQDISGKADKATTLAGYGITDVSISNGKITIGSNSITPLTSHQSLANYYTKNDIASLMSEKADVTHTHNYLSTLKVGTTSYSVSSNSITIPAYPTTLPASDVYAWAKAATKPSYTFSEIGSKPTTLSGYGITDGVNTVTTSGSGNAVTSASISGHTLTLTKGATYLTSHQSLSNYYTKSEANSTFLGIKDTAENSKAIDGHSLDSLVCTKTIATKKDYENSVILLWEDAAISYNFIQGLFYTWYHGVSRYQCADIRLAFSRWSSTGYDYHYQFNTFGMGIAVKLVTCTYNGKLWWAIQHTNTQAVVMYFTGRYTSGIALENINYYNTDTKTVLNSEIYNSITDQSSKISTFYVGGIKNALVTDNVASASKASKVANALSWSGYSSGSYDGSATKTISIPNNTNQLTNGAGFITSSASITGNAATATKLQTARSINGTSFNGTANITTATWGTARNIGIVNSDGSGTAVTVSVNGSAAVNLKLPSTIKATITGNADSATKLQTARTIWGQSFNGTANISGALTGVTTITASGQISAGSIKLGDVILSYNSTYKGIRVQNGGLYADTYVSALGANTVSGGTSSSTNYTVKKFQEAISLTSEDTTVIPTAYSIYTLYDIVSSNLGVINSDINALQNKVATLEKQVSSGGSSSGSISTTPTLSTIIGSGGTLNIQASTINLVKYGSSSTLSLASNIMGKANTTLVLVHGLISADVMELKNVYSMTFAYVKSNGSTTTQATYSFNVSKAKELGVLT